MSESVRKLRRKFDTRQPTILREKTSVMKATSSHESVEVPESVDSVLHRTSADRSLRRSARKLPPPRHSTATISPQVESIGIMMLRIPKPNPIVRAGSVSLVVMVQTFSTRSLFNSTLA